MQRYTVYFIWKLLYMFRVVPPPIIRCANNCIYSIWYLSHRYCYLPLSWKSWNWFECAVGGVLINTFRQLLHYTFTYSQKYAVIWTVPNTLTLKDLGMLCVVCRADSTRRTSDSTA